MNTKINIWITELGTGGRSGAWRVTRVILASEEMFLLWLTEEKQAPGVCFRESHTPVTLTVEQDPHPSHSS